MLAVYKYSLAVEEQPESVIDIEAPANAYPLAVDWEFDRIVVFMLADNAQPSVTHRFHAFRTGQEFSADLGEIDYLDTVFYDDDLAYHIFYGGEQ